MARFTTTIELGGKTATGFAVPDEVVAALDSGKRPKVKVTIGSYSYRTTVASMGGRFMIPLAAEHREGAGVAAGDEVKVDLVLDTAPRSVEEAKKPETRQRRIEKCIEATRAAAT